jgi:hypothetical protein
MRCLSASEAAGETLPSLFEKAKATPIIVTDGGSSMGAIVSMKDYEMIRQIKNERVFAALDAVGKELRENAVKQGVSLEELEILLDRKRA